MIITKKKSKLLLTTIILTIIHMSLLLLAALALVFNIFGIVDIMNMILQDYLEAGVTIDYYLATYYFELGLSFVVNFSCVRLYIKGYRYGVYGEVFGRRIIMNSIIQLLFSSFLPGIFALVTGIMMSKQKQTLADVQAQSEEYINEMKLAAMSEAVTRLKELRASGAISEEEYYANINKILEG